MLAKEPLAGDQAVTEHLRNDSPSEEQRAHDIKLAIEQIYYQVYMPRFNKAKGVPTIDLSSAELYRQLHIPV